MSEHAGSNVPPPTPAVPRQRRLRIGAVVALVLVAGFVAWLLLRDGDSSSSASPIPARSTALPISVKGLHTLATLGIPIYWIGQRPGYKYELTKTPDNRVFLRYLPEGTKIGSTTNYLTIGTYPAKNAFADTRRLAASSGSVKLPAPKGGVAYYRSDTPTNVFLAFPGVNYRVEVYDPSAGRAQDLVTLGQVAPAR